MATIAKRAFEVVKTLSGNSPQVLPYEEAATQTFKKGDLLVFNGSGYITSANALTDPTGIVGIAAEDAHNSTNAGDNKINVVIANDDVVFIGNLSGSSVSARNIVGRGWGVVYTSPVWLVDITETTAANTRVIIQALDPRDTVGDTNARVHFMFKQRDTALSSTS